MNLLKKCRGEASGGQACPDKWTCQRYYVRENAAGWLEPALYGQGCADFLALGGTDRAAHFAHGGYLPGCGGGD